MAHAKLLLDTNIVIDYLNEREPFYKSARLLMICGRVGELDFWITASQVTDLIYILSDGGSRSLIPAVLERLKGLRTFVSIFPITDCEVDRMLASSWKDPEDALMFEAALRMKADAIVTRNQADFESALVQVFDCEQLFDWLESVHGLCYAEVDF